MKPLTEILRERAHFDFCRDGQLFYTTQSGFRFAVPIAEIGTGTCLADDRAAVFMKSAAVKNLKRALNPLYTALRQIFGEIDVLVSPDEPSTSSPTIDRRVAAVWEDWKRRYPGKTADVIDALLLHGEKNTTQLSILAHTSKGNITNIVSRLTQLGLINKNGGKFSLKPL